MKSTTRILAALLVLVMIFGLAACTKTDVPATEPSAADSPATEPSSAASEETATPTSDPIHLKWYVAGNAPQPDVDTVVAEMEKYILENYNLNLDLEIVCTDFGSYNDKMQMVIGSGEEYDICWASSWCNDYYTNVAKNAFLPLDDLLVNEGKEILNVIPEGVIEACRVNGSIYAIPNYQSEYKQNMIAIAQKYIDEFGLDVSSVTKLSDLNDFFYAIKAAYPDMYPLCVTPGQFDELTLAQGYEAIINTKVPGAIQLGDESLTVVNQWELPSVQEDIELMYRWCQDGIIRMDAATVQESGVPDLKAGMHAAVIDATYTIDSETAVYPDQFGGQDVSCIMLSDAWTFTQAPIATVNAISTTSKNPAAAMQLLKIVNTDAELFNLLCFGIEGTHYTVNEDGTASSIASAGYDPNTDWVFGDQFNAIPRAGQSADIWEKTKAKNDSAKISTAMGFTFDASAVSNEIAACTAVYDQYIEPLTMGSIDPATGIPEMLSKLESAGYKTILDEIQRQVNEWAGK